MENMDGFADLKKPLIPSHSALAIASVSIADTIFLTNLQKRGKTANRSSP
jgi:hypothetical protein